MTLSDVSQHPFVDVVPVEPDIPLIVDVPGHGRSETPGTGTPIVVLSPGELSSVAPSGMVLRLPVPRPNPADGATTIPCELPAPAGAHVLAIDEPDIPPPPSKVELDPDNPVP